MQDDQFSKNQANYSKSLTLIKDFAPAVGAAVTAVFVALTWGNINAESDQRRIENEQREIDNALLILERLKPHIEIIDGEEPYTPKEKSRNIAGVRQKIRNASSAMVNWRVDGISIYDCEGKPHKLEIWLNENTSRRSLMKPELDDRDNVQTGHHQIFPFSKDTITLFAYGLNRYSKEQILAAEQPQTLVLMFHVRFWVDGVSYFEDWIKQHGSLLYDQTISESSVDPNKPPFSIVITIPVILEIGKGMPRVLDGAYCREGISEIRNR